VAQVDEVMAELRKIPWFQELKEEHMLTIASISNVHRFHAGDVLFREGDTQVP
jgi:CRP-like cAMP-binding protein